MISALVGHLVGDYLVQNDWMALNKKKSMLPCLVHCAIWATCVVLFAVAFMGRTDCDFGVELNEIELFRALVETDVK